MMVANLSLGEITRLCLSVLELVDAAIPAEKLEPIRQTILQVEGVKVWTVRFTMIAMRI